MTEIRIAGETFNVRLEGDESKEVLALAHHLGGSLAVWEPLLPSLLEHFRVLRWDSRGHGGSVANQGPYSIAQLARDALAIFDALGIEKAHWVGLSMGAVVGQAVLIEARSGSGEAVLANTGAKLGTPDIWNARIKATRKEGLAAAAGSVARALVHAGVSRGRARRCGSGALHFARNPASGLRRSKRGSSRRRSARSDPLHSQQGAGHRRAT